ncbi:MAG TPA: ABC transporter ATP-binding protein [Actinomycetota bacterium]
MSAVIECTALRKEYRRLRGGVTIAVESLDLAVTPGGVFGFLGPNGSGKTTTIRCLLGLIRSSRGSTRLLGAPPDAVEKVMRRVGSIVETPIFFPTFSGRRNLELLGRIYGIGRKPVREVLERVGLGGREDDLVKTYSLGMKQRLGIAAALLKDPELLILDEPANGLDPAGIKEVRELLRSLGAEGRTVFLSSHLLNEVQHVCDQVAIISRGKLITQGPVSEVLAAGRAAALSVRLADPDAGATVLQAAGFEVVRTEGGLRVIIDPAESARVTEALARKKLYVSELRPEAIDLETVFLELTAEQEEPAL